MRVLALTKYGPRAASTRYRFEYMRPWLEAAGIQIELSPLLDDVYLAQRLTSERVDRGAMLRGFARRFARLLLSARYDVIWLQYEAVPFLPPAIELRALTRGAKLVLDLDDAVFHSYDLHGNAWVRRLLGDKIGRLARAANATLAGSPYLLDFVRSFGGTGRFIPTAVDPSIYPVKTHAPLDALTVGWIGSPSSSRYLELVEPALERLGAQIPVRLLTIGARPRTLSEVEVVSLPWDPSTELSDLSRADVGIMPMVDEPWARGKCAFKLIQYAALGLPVLATPIGMNARVVGEDAGFLPESLDAWVDRLAELFADTELRARLGAAGRRRVEEEFAFDVVGPRLVSVFEGLSSGRTNHA